MIILNGKKFAKNDKEFTSSLFDDGGTCVGYYKKTSKNIFLLDHNKNRIGLINSYYVLGTATKQQNNKYRYSYGTPTLIGNFDSYSKKKEQVAEIYNTLFA